MNLAELETLFSEMERLPGTLSWLLASDDQPVRRLSEDLEVTFPPDYVEFFSKYSVLNWGPNELLGPDRCGRLLEIVPEGSKPPRHWIPIMEDGAGGDYYIVAALRGKKHPANFGAVMYISWDDRQGLPRKLGKSLYCFVAQRCRDWLDERAEELVAEKLAEPALPQPAEKRESIDEILARLEPTDRGWRATLPQRFAVGPGESIDLIIITRSDGDSGLPPPVVKSEKKLARLILASWLDVSRLATSACAQHHIAQQNHSFHSQAMSREIVIDRDTLAFDGPERWKLVFRLGRIATEVCFDGVVLREVRAVSSDS